MLHDMQVSKILLPGLCKLDTLTSGFTSPYSRRMTIQLSTGPQHRARGTHIGSLDATSGLSICQLQGSLHAVSFLRLTLPSKYLKILK